MLWRLLVDSDFSRTLFFKIGKFQWTFSEGEFSWTLFVHENSSSWVNIRGHIFGEFQWTLFDGDNKQCQHCWSAKSVHQNSPILSTKIRLLCPREVCHLYILKRIKSFICYLVNWHSVMGQFKFMCKKLYSQSFFLYFNGIEVNSDFFTLIYSGHIFEAP